MRSLFWKGMLAFLAVIIVAVGTVALLVGRATESEFRRYALVHGGVLDRQVEALAAYYAEHGSWAGLQDLVTAMHEGQGWGWGGGKGGVGFRLTDPEGRVVVDTARMPEGTVPSSELDSGLPITVDGEIVGYLLPFSETMDRVPLDLPQEMFLRRVRASLLLAGLAALMVALLIGGLLFRSIIAPLRGLTTASQAIADGDLSVRAPVRGRDEVAQLAVSFNRMAESLDRAEEARRNQTADIAHELRTPLTVLQGTLEAMLDGVYPTDRENIWASLAQVQMLNRMVEDLRLLALADAGQLQLQASTLDLERFLRETVEGYQAQARERGVALALETSPTLSPVLADRERLAQVVGNLLSNGLRYVPRGGHIAVRATGGRGEVAVSVADDGPGVPEEDLPHLFERFWRGDPARRRASGGSGLGLAIVRRIVEAHGGRTWAEPTPGGGLTITFTLPTVPE